jgi:prephenate dehydratase
VTDLAASPTPSDVEQRVRIGFLGPPGTFTESALHTQSDLAELELVSLESIRDVLAAVQEGTVDLGFVPIENAIEGSVNITLDTLSFETDLLIQREVVIPIHNQLIARPGVELDDVERVLSMPMATAQCRTFLNEHLAGVPTQACNSTSEAARMVHDEPGRAWAAIGTSRAAELYGLDVIAPSIEDHPDNATRFVVVAREGVPAPTGHDKTTIVVFQRADAPGSLLAILQEFAARSINLSNLESRPTKTALGDYCFLMELDGHITDEVVADALRSLKAKQSDVKFLGSYPAAGEQGEGVRADADAAALRADEWLRSLRSQVRF